MTAKEQHQLANTLWEIADTLRGAMNPDDFRDYMLSFLFLFYLSNNYENVIEKTLKPKDKTDNWLLDWYKQNEKDIPAFEKQIKRTNHYIIKPEFLWANIAELASKQDNELLNTLQKAFKSIEEGSFANNFRGLFSEINLTSDKLGKTYTERNKMLCKVINTIDEKISSFNTDGDLLGDAYEFLIGKFAAGSGQKAGEFYTPKEISTILANIVTLGCQNPRIGKKSLNNILDFACGSGSLLLSIRKRLKNNVGKIYGQEKNITTYNLARMNMLLHNVKDTEFEIYHGDTLTNDWDIFRDKNPANKITFDAVVANPPFSYRWEPDDNTVNDFRFADYGVAPKSAADFAFLLHGFHYLSKEGVMAIILPHGVLFRGGAEERIRRKLIDDGNIDTVIGLPSNLFYSTGIPVCILVLKKCKAVEDVLFINSAEHFEKGKRQNNLAEDNLEKIISTYREHKEEARYSRLVSVDEIKKNDYNLNISRYINTAIEEEDINLNNVHKQLLAIDKNIKKATDKHNKFLKELGLKPLP